MLIPDLPQYEDFATAFGKALVDFLQEKHITQSDAARRLGLHKGGKARLNTYCRTSSKRAKPDAEILYLLCVKLGFSFDYNGYKISAITLGRTPLPAPDDPNKQLSFEFERQFQLTDQGGAVSVRIKRPSGRIEVSVSLDAAAS